ncbi:MAG: hypothetical protein WCK27_18645 [Verrucomicrobiota bacterium]
MTRKPKALRPGSDCWVREESAFAPLALHNVRVRGDSEAPPWLWICREPSFRQKPGLPKSARGAQVSQTSSLWPRMDQAYAGEVLFAGCSRSAGAGNGIRLSKPKSLDLAFNLVPSIGRPCEDNRVPALKMRPQLFVAQEPSIDAFHR